MAIQNFRGDVDDFRTVGKRMDELEPALIEFKGNIFRSRISGVETEQDSLK